MNTLLKCDFRGIKSVILHSKWVKMFNQQGTYATARKLQKEGYSIEYTLAALSLSKYGNNKPL